MKKMPWVRFFASDWLAGTRGMSAAETGVYITLIATMYERQEPIPEDHTRLARLCGASNSSFKKALDVLIEDEKIIRTDAGLWNERVQKERVYLSEKSEVGLQAANARWGKKDNENNGEIMQTQCERNADAMPFQKPYTRVNNNSNELLENEKKSKKKNGGLEEFKSILSPHMSDGLLNDFITHRRSKKASNTETSANMFLKAANDAGLTPTQAAEIAIERNWITVKREWLNNSGRNNSKPEMMTIAGAAARAAEEMRRNEQFNTMEPRQSNAIGRGESGRTNVRPALPKFPV